MNLYLKPEINLAEKPFQRDSWTQHISIRLRPIFSTTSLALPRIVPTFHEDNVIYIFYTYMDTYTYVCLCILSYVCLCIRMHMYMHIYRYVYA